jgi:hypothetical protein
MAFGVIPALVRVLVNRLLTLGVLGTGTSTMTVETIRLTDCVGPQGVLLMK